MSNHRPINVAPYATNVLDLVGRNLCTPDGRKVKIGRAAIDFVIQVDGERPFSTPDNIVASRFLNSFEVGFHDSVCQQA